MPGSSSRQAEIRCSAEQASQDESQKKKEPKWKSADLSRIFHMSRLVCVAFELGKVGAERNESPQI